MDAKMAFLGLSTMTHNFFLRAGARTIRDVVEICDGRKSRKNIPERCIKEAKEAVKMQEAILGVKFLNQNLDEKVRYE